MHDTCKQDYLAQAERHIAIAEDRIARQKRIIDELVQFRTGDRLRRLDASCSGDVLARYYLAGPARYDPSRSLAY
jgi:hypothetical protein